jgi:hypothetical protein
MTITSLIDRFKLKTGLIVEEITISHNGGSVDDQGRLRRNRI